MSSLKLVNLFTYVVLFFSAVSFWPVDVKAQATQSSCGDNPQGVTKYTDCMTIPEGTARTACGNYKSCLLRLDEDRNRENTERQAQDTECDGLYDRSLDQMQDAERECGRAGWGSFSSCQSRASGCGASLALDQGADEESMSQGINNLMGMWMMSQNMQNGGAQNSLCTIVDQKATQDKRERIEEQISRLQEQNQDSVTKQADLDDDFSKRQEETEEKIREAEEDVEKKKIERQTKIQEENTRIQKAVLTSQKKQFDNLQNINKKNIEIANLQFAHQQINIESSDLRMNKTCRDKVLALQKALTTEPPPQGAPAGAPTKKKQLKSDEARKIKQDLKFEETTCLQVESLKRTAQLKGLFDKRAGLQAEVDTLTRGNEDEAKSIEIEKKSFEELKLTMEAEEKTDAENKFKKLNTLSASLARFKETIDKKKKSQVDRIALREQQIQRLVLSKNEVVVKELDVNSKLQNAGRTRQSFRDRCCSSMRSSRYTRTASSSSSRTASSSYIHPSCSTEASTSSGSSEPSRGR
jgi:hypothetical protein